jgi:hypothetical protein
MSSRTDLPTTASPTQGSEGRYFCPAGKRSLRVVRPEGGKKKYLTRRGSDRVPGAGRISIKSSDGRYWLPKIKTGVESSQSRRGAPVASVKAEELSDPGIRSLHAEAQSDGGRSDNNTDNGSVEEDVEESGEEDVKEGGEGDDDIGEESREGSGSGIVEGSNVGDTTEISVSAIIEARQSHFEDSHHPPLTTLATGLTKQWMCSSFLFGILWVSQKTFLPLSCRSC